MLLKRSNKPLRFESNRTRDGSYWAGSLHVWPDGGGVSLVVDERIEKEVLAGLIRLQQSSNEVVLKTSIVSYNNQIAEMAVEPLCYKVDDPCTFDDLVAAENFDYFFVDNKDLGAKVFCTKFKRFLRALIKFILEASKDNVFIKVDAKNIVLTAKNEFKIFDLTSVYRNCSKSLDSLQRTLSLLTKSVIRRKLLVAPEINYFEKAPLNATLLRHPAILERGQKMQFLLELYDCIHWWNLKVDDGDRSPVQNWEYVIPQYRYLKYVLWAGTDKKGIYAHSNGKKRKFSGRQKGSKKGSKKGEVDTVKRFIEYMRHAKHHINDHVDKERVRTPDFDQASPLSPHKYGNLKYTDVDLEKIVDHLFPQFMSWLHNQNYYEFLDKKR